MYSDRLTESRIPLLSLLHMFSNGKATPLYGRTYSGSHLSNIKIEFEKKLLVMYTFLVKKNDIPIHRKNNGYEKGKKNSISLKCFFCVAQNTKKIQTF